MLLYCECMRWKIFIYLFFFRRHNDRKCPRRATTNNFMSVVRECSTNIYKWKCTCKTWSLCIRIFCFVKCIVLWESMLNVCKYISTWNIKEIVFENVCEWRADSFCVCMNGICCWKERNFHEWKRIEREKHDGMDASMY